MSTERSPLPVRLGWFVLYWVGGVAAVATVGYAIKLLLQA